MALTTEQKASFLFKQAQGVAETSILKDFFEESLKGRILVLNNQIWVQSDQIPSTAPSLADGATSGVVRYFEARTMTAVAGVNNSFYLEDLKDSIPFNFGDGSYNYVITSSTGTAIPFGQGDWLINNTTGTLTFYGSVPANMPPKISFYKYVGAKGAGGEGSLPAIYVVATIAERDALSPKQGDLCVVTANNETYAWASTSWVLLQSAGAVSSVNGQTGVVSLNTDNITEGANKYFTDDRAKAAAVINDTSGSQIDQAASIAAMKAYIQTQGAPVTSVNGQTGEVNLIAESVGAIAITEKGVANGVATLDASGFVPQTQLPTAPVTSVNTQTGDVLLSTSDIGEGTNLYFTDERAKTASVVNSAAGSETDQAPSVAAIKQYISEQGAPVVSVNGQTGAVNLMSFDVGAIALTEKGVANGVATLDASGFVPQTQLPTAPVTSVNTQTGDVVLSTSDIGEGTNLYFTDERAKTASVVNSAAGSETDQAPSVAAIKQYISEQGAPVVSVNGETGAVILNAADVGAISNNGDTMTGALIMGPTGTTAGSGGVIRFRELAANGANYIAFKAADSIAADVTWTLPATDGTSGQAIVTNGTGTLSWASIPSSANFVQKSGDTMTGALIMGPTGASAGSGGVIRLRELAANGTNSVAFKAADSIATDVTWTLPATDGTSGQSLTTNGAGVLSWASATAGSNSLSSLNSYSSDFSTLKGQYTFSNSSQTLNFDYWVGNGPLNAGKYGSTATGIQNAGASFGGTNGVTNLGTTELSNGISWTTSAATLPTARTNLASSGIQNSSLIFGGFTTTNSAATERFNGTSFSNTGNLTTARSNLGGAGIENAALAFGGSVSGTASNVTEKFNGSIWSTSGSYGSAPVLTAGAGTQNAALGFGGGSTLTTTSAITIKFNGSIWNNAANMNTARRELGGSGTQNAALSFGGYTTLESRVCEKFNGYTWSNTGSLISARYSLGGAGTQNSSFSCGGLIPTISIITEIFQGQLKQGFQGIFKGTSNSIIVSNDSNSLTSSFGSETGILQLDVIFNQNDGLSTAESNWIAELEKEGQKPSYWIANSYLSVNRAAAGSAGTGLSSIVFGGWTTSSSTDTNSTEVFNGSAWSSGGSLTNARSQLAGAGIQNAGLSFGGITSGTTYSSISEKYNGASWSSTGSLQTSRRGLGGAGVQNAALCFAGGTASTSNVTEKFDGTNWVTFTYMLTSRNFIGGCGIQNAALGFGGNTGSAASSLTEKFNGSTWSATTSMLNARQALAGCGTQNAANSFGGVASGVDSAITEKFNGSIWSLSGSLSVARNNICGSGSQSSCLGIAGAQAITSVGLVEDFEYYMDFIPKTYGNGTWSSTGALTAARAELGGAGTQNAAVAFGGYTNSVTNSNVTDKFNNTTWSASGNLTTATRSLAGCGTQNAAVAFGGDTGTTASPVNTAATYKFNGSTWSTSGNLNTARRRLGGAGNQNSALSFGGFGANYAPTTEKFNGSTWSNSNSLSTAREGLAAAGTQNATLAFGGYRGGSTGTTERYNGNYWAAASAIVGGARSNLAGAGNSRAALAIGGDDVGFYYDRVNKYNSTDWVTTSSISSARGGVGGCGTQNAAITFGGTTGTISSISQKYNETLAGDLQYG
jgi:hypothetical protein